MAYHVFQRTWWKDNEDYPDGLEPHCGDKHTMQIVSTEEEARAICRIFNNSHDAGRYSNMAEYNEV